MNEVFKTVPNFPRYQISNLGRVKSLINNIILKPHVDPNNGGYSVNLCDDMYGEKVRKQIKILVAESFIPNPEGYRYVKHKDGNLGNNSVDNLEWTKRREL